MEWLRLVIGKVVVYEFFDYVNKYWVMVKKVKVIRILRVGICDYFNLLVFMLV